MSKHVKLSKSTRYHYRKKALAVATLSFRNESSYCADNSTQSTSLITGSEFSTNISVPNIANEIDCPDSLSELSYSSTDDSNTSTIIPSDSDDSHLDLRGTLAKWAIDNDITHLACDNDEIDATKFKEELKTYIYLKVGKLGLSAAIRNAIDTCFEKAVLNNYSYHAETKKKFIKLGLFVVISEALSGLRRTVEDETTFKNVIGNYLRHSKK